MNSHVTDARSFLDEHWAPDRSLSEWHELVVDNGWAAPRWPTEWFGRGLSNDAAKEVEAIFAAADAPGPGHDRTNLWAGTLLGYGSDTLKRQFLRPLLIGDVAMCLLYSEPGAGSDLAGLRTTAVRDGDEYVVNGQKVWTSGARGADYGMLIARTDWDVPKHRGITFFWFPMKQEGVEVRPLRQMTGDSRFNEVFIADGRVSSDNIVGGLNNGWGVLQAALAYERAAMGRPGSRARKETSDRVDKTAEAMGPIPTPDLSLVELAQDLAKNGDPLVRQQLARIHALRKVAEWNGDRAKAELKMGGSSPLFSLGKLAMSGLLHEAGRVQGWLLGAEGVLDGDQYPRSRDANYSQLNAYFTSIGGGTDQIQRNIIGERILGLPREPEPDRTKNFRDVPANG